jgi:hypothetical protein
VLGKRGIVSIDIRELEVGYQVEVGGEAVELCIPQPISHGF